MYYHDLLIVTLSALLLINKNMLSLGTTYVSFDLRSLLNTLYEEIAMIIVAHDQKKHMGLCQMLDYVNLTFER